MLKIINCHFILNIRMPLAPHQSFLYISLFIKHIPILMNGLVFNIKTYYNKASQAYQVQTSISYTCKMYCNTERMIASPYSILTNFNVSLQKKYLCHWCYINNVLLVHHISTFSSVSYEQNLSPLQIQKITNFTLAYRYVYT